MSEVERKFMQDIDNLILQARGNSLEKLRELDFKNQLGAETFYDVYANNFGTKIHENVPSTSKKKT